MLSDRFGIADTINIRSPMPSHEADFAAARITGSDFPFSHYSQLFISDDFISAAHAALHGNTAQIFNTTPHTGGKGYRYASATNGGI